MQLFIPSSAVKIGRETITDFNGQETVVVIDDKERKKIIRSVSQFVIAKYPNNVEGDEFRQALAKIIIELFPIFRTNEAPYFGADSFYDPKYKKGYLVNALNYKKQRETALLHEASSSKRIRLEPAEPSQTAKKKMEELKSIMLVDEKDKALEIMRATMKERRLAVKQDCNLYKEFPFYFAMPELVSFFFNL